MGWVVGGRDWHFERFILTNKRVMVVHGIITRHVAMMPLERVTDMKYEQTPLGRILNYGTFVLESAGQDQALREVPHLPNPNELYLRVVEEMYEPAAVEARLGGVEDEDEEEIASTLTPPTGGFTRWSRPLRGGRPTGWDDPGVQSAPMEQPQLPAMPQRLSPLPQPAGDL